MKTRSKQITVKYGGKNVCLSLYLLSLKMALKELKLSKTLRRKRMEEGITAGKWCEGNIGRWQYVCTRQMTKNWHVRL